MEIKQVTIFEVYGKQFPSIEEATHFRNERENPDIPKQIKRCTGIQEYVEFFYTLTTPIQVKLALDEYQKQLQEGADAFMTIDSWLSYYSPSEVERKRLTELLYQAVEPIPIGKHHGT